MSATVAHASGSERFAFLPCNSVSFRGKYVFCFCFFPCSTSASASFRVFPCSSVANSSASAFFRILLLLLLPSVFFRVNPWLILCLFFCLISVAMLLLFRPRLRQLRVCGVPFLAAYLTFYLSDKKSLQLVI